MLALSSPLQFILTCLLIAVPLYKLLKRRIETNPLNNIPGPRATSWWNGNFSEVYGFEPSTREFHEMLGKKYGTTSAFQSVHGARELYTFDPKAMHHILVKDQPEFYEETSGSLETCRLLFGGGLLASTGDIHRKQRKMLTPVFSIAHMREMLPIFYDVTHKLENTIARKVQEGPQEIDILSWMTRTALELIGQSGMGYSFDSLEDEEHAHPYPEALKELGPLVTTPIAQFVRGYILPMASIISSDTVFWSWVVPYIPSQVFQRARYLVNYMWEVSAEIYEGKRKALAAGDEEVVNQIGRGKDILSILIKENMKGSEEERLSEEEIICQMSTFIFAGMDTTSTALSRTLTLLAEHPEIQSKLRQEIISAFAGGDISYDQLVSLPYLDAVCRESLRLHPPAHSVTRTTVKDTTLPLSNAIAGVDGTTVSEIFMPKGTNIYISILNSNRNPDVWGPDAEEWKPERWLDPLPDKVADAKIPGIYHHLMTFIGGGRSCIGFKFSQLEMKVVLARLIHRFEFLPTKKEVFWRMTAVASPVVVGPGATGQTELPIVVKLVRD